MKIFRCIFRLHGMQLLLCDNLRINRCIWMYVGLCLETSSRTNNIKVCIGFRYVSVLTEHLFDVNNQLPFICVLGYLC